MPDNSQAGWGWVVRESRLWVTLLWSMTLALGLAGGQWAEQRFAALAADTSIILAPQHPLDEAAQRDAQDKLGRDAAILSARWLTPDEVKQALARTVPLPEWADKLGDDATPFPALLELTPDRPLDQAAALNTFVSARNAEGTWLVFWDGARVGELRVQRGEMRGLLAVWLALVLIFGAFALARLPWPLRRGWWLAIVAALLGTLAPLALVLAAWQAEVPGISAMTLLIAGGTGLLLAGGAASMLRVRGHVVYYPPLDPRETLEQSGPSLNLSIKEAPDERNW